MTEEIFINLISSSFWNHIFKKTYVPIPSSIDRKHFLHDLFEEVQSNSYNPSIPREYVISNKHNLVSRIVPVLSVKDICIYYFCIKILEDNLAKNRVEGTFGGFSMGGSFRKLEDEEFKEIAEIPFSISTYTYNPLAWVNAWRDFQKKAWIYGSKYTCFIKLDIANFYDTINLLLLERMIRSSCEKKHSDTIDLLFHFLANWNKHFEKYRSKTVGIPQDEVGDCSRILANFYLQDFDRAFSKFCRTLNVQYLRYADDIFVMGTNLHIAKEALFVASKEFAKIGLNINSSKVEIFSSKKEYSDYWAFEIFDKLGDPDNIADIEDAIDMYRKFIEGKIKFKEDSVLKRIINCNIMKLGISKKQYIMARLLDDNFLQNIEEYPLRRVYSFLEKSDRIILKSKLEELIPIVLFNKFHFVLLKTNDIFKFNTSLLYARINELRI